MIFGIAAPWLSGMGEGVGAIAPLGARSSARSDRPRRSPLLTILPSIYAILQWRASTASASPQSLGSERADYYDAH